MTTAQKYEQTNAARKYAYTHARTQTLNHARTQSRMHTRTHARFQDYMIKRCRITLYRPINILI